MTVDSSGDVIERNEYTYDVNDNRIAKSVDADGDGTQQAEVERYVLDGQEIALVFDGDAIGGLYKNAKGLFKNADEAIESAVESGVKQASPPKFSHDVTDDDLSRLQQIRDSLGKAGQDKHGELGLKGSVRKGITKTKKGQQLPHTVVAFADVQVDGKNLTVGGFAGKDNFSAFAPMTEEFPAKLPSTKVGRNFRDNDAEIKILEQILRDTTDSSTGNIRLVVDRTSCKSCADSAIQEFYKRRPGIALEIVQGADF